MKLIVLLVFMLILASATISALRINEVMYNPIGDDNNREYVEIYFDDSDTNLSNYIIADASSSDVPRLVKYSDSRYALVVEDGFDYTGVEASIYSVGKAIGNTLNNDGDAVILKDSSGRTIDTFTYTSGIGGNSDGSTLCLIDNQWAKCKPTPGVENAQFETTESTEQFSDSKEEIIVINSKAESETNNTPNINIAQEKNSNSYIEIVEVNDLKFNSIGKAKLNIYKGNAEKNSIKIWVENDFDTVSEVTSLNVYGKFVNLTLVVPLLIKECITFLPEYKLIVEGLGLKESENVELTGCNNDIDESEAQLNLTDGNTSKIIYESKRTRFSKGLLYSMLAVLFILVPYLLLSKRTNLKKPESNKLT